MTAQEIRKAYVEFLVSKGHKVIPRAPLVPLNDPSTLFTGSGMQPLVPYLLGDDHPSGTRLVDSQPCIRAQDIDEVGNNRHTTFFEMLGNWSLGDYFKIDQLTWFWEFLTDRVGLDPERIYVTCYSGNQEFNLPKDTESAEIWKVLFANKGITAKEVDLETEENGYKKGMQDGRIFYYGDKNWWSRTGAPERTEHGEPCGPDSEVFYLYPNVEHDTKWGEHCHVNCDCGRFIELGNSVFMQYQRTSAANGHFIELPKQNVDYGGGLERIASAAIDSPDVFKCSLLWPVIQSLEEQSGKNYDSHHESMRVIADHLRGAVFLATDGVEPSNKEQGYVMRRLMRRAIRFAFELGIESGMCERITPVIIDIYAGDYPDVAEKRDQIIQVLVREERAFQETLRKGLHEFEKIASVKYLGGNEAPGSGSVMFGTEVFKLHDTYGFPVELTLEEAFKRGINLEENWKEKFDYEMSMQRERSQTAGKGVFKGGLADHSEETTKLHTSHHLLLRALKDELGDHVFQRGSNITAERLRIDFSHPEKVTREVLDKIEKVVNDKIAEDLPVIRSEIAREKAEALNAEREFGAKYPDIVSVYSVGPKGATVDDPKHEQAYSIEFCGGPHVEHTGLIAEGGKRFKITKEESSSSGVRRIKAVLVS